MRLFTFTVLAQSLAYNGVVGRTAARRLVRAEEHPHGLAVVDPATGKISFVSSDADAQVEEASVSMVQDDTTTTEGPNDYDTDDSKDVEPPEAAPGETTAAEEEDTTTTTTTTTAESTTTATTTTEADESVKPQEEETTEAPSETLAPDSTDDSGADQGGSEQDNAAASEEVSLVNRARKSLLERGDSDGEVDEAVETEASNGDGEVEKALEDEKAAEQEVTEKEDEKDESGEIKDDGAFDEPMETDPPTTTTTTGPTTENSQDQVLDKATEETAGEEQADETVAKETAEEKAQREQEAKEADAQSEAAESEEEKEADQKLKGDAFVQVRSFLRARGSGFDASADDAADLGMFEVDTPDEKDARNANMVDDAVTMGRAKHLPNEPKMEVDKALQKAMGLAEADAATEKAAE